jgi:hypothetical protein
VVSGISQDLARMVFLLFVGYRTVPTTTWGDQEEN